MQNGVVVCKCLKTNAACKKVRAAANELETLATEGIADALKDLGSSGPGFPRKMQEIEKLLAEKKHSDFDRGMVELGTLLGFNAWKTDAQATPDCIWQLGNEIVYLFEGKSEANPESPISVDDCRQASGHLKWASAEPQLKNCKAFRSILVTPRTAIDKNAVPHATNLFFMVPSDMQSLFERTKAILSAIRSVMTDEADEEFKEKIMSELITNDLTPASLQKLLLSKPVTALKQLK